MSNAIEDLERLKKIKESGVLTEEEFNMEKTKILSNDGNNKMKKNKKLDNILFIVGIILIIVIIIGGATALSDGMLKKDAEDGNALSSSYSKKYEQEGGQQYLDPAAISPNK